MHHLTWSAFSRTNAANQTPDDRVALSKKAFTSQIALHYMVRQCGGSSPKWVFDFCRTRCTWYRWKTPTMPWSMPALRRMRRYLRFETSMNAKFVSLSRVSRPPSFCLQLVFLRWKRFFTAQFSICTRFFFLSRHANYIFSWNHSPIDVLGVHNWWNGVFALEAEWVDFLHSNKGCMVLGQLMEQLSGHSGTASSMKWEGHFWMIICYAMR